MPTTQQPGSFLAFAVAATGLLLAFGSRPPAGRTAPTRQHSRPDATPSGSPSGSPSGTRGRDAATPGEIPARGWWDILKRTASQVSDDRVLTEAAGITFFSLLALFPAVAALISIYGLFADPATITEHLEALSGVVPGGGMEIIGDQVKRIASKEGATLGIGLAIGLATSLWSANQAMKALVDALNVVYGQTEKRGFFRRLAVTMAFTFGGILFVVLAMVGVVAVPVVLKFVGLGDLAETLLSLARWPVMLLAVILFLAAIYRFGPSRQAAQWRWVSWGSAAAGIGWVAFSIGFSWYVTNFGNYNETYGSLGAVIGFMTWIWLSATVVLVGAEVNSEMEHQTARDTTTGPEQPLGTRGARMADTVAG